MVYNLHCSGSVQSASCLFLCELWACLSIVTFLKEETDAISPQRVRSAGYLLAKHPLPHDAPFKPDKYPQVL